MEEPGKSQYFACRFAHAINVYFQFSWSLSPPFVTGALCVPCTQRCICVSAIAFIILGVIAAVIAVIATVGIPPPTPGQSLLSYGLNYFLLKHLPQWFMYITP